MYGEKEQRKFNRILLLKKKRFKMKTKINPRQIKTGLIYGPIQPPQMKFMSKEEKITYLKDQNLDDELYDLFMNMDIIKTESKKSIEFLPHTKKEG